MDPKNKSEMLKQQLAKIEEYERNIQEMKKELAELGEEEGDGAVPRKERPANTFWYEIPRDLFCRVSDPRLTDAINEWSDYMVHMYGMRGCRKNNRVRSSDFARQIMLHGLWRLPDADQDPRQLTEQDVLERLESAEIKQEVKRRLGGTRNYFEL